MGKHPIALPQVRHAGPDAPDFSSDILAQDGRVLDPEAVAAGRSGLYLPVDGAKEEI